jgi:hypothetical protein
MIGLHTINEAFDAFKTAKPEMVALVTVQCDRALQPRDVSLLTKSERPQERNGRKKQIVGMVQRLSNSPRMMFDPLYLARIDGALYVVDGHTRLDAYRKAGRTHARAVIVPMSREVAVMVSKIVNTTPRARELQTRMTNEAWWAVLWQLSDNGRSDPGRVARTIAERFGVNKDRPTAACKWLRNGWVDPEAFPPEQRDPDSGRPFYSAVALAMHRRFAGEVTHSEDDATRNLATALERFATQYIKVATKYTGRQRYRARMLALDRIGQQTDAAEMLQFLGECEGAAGMPDEAAPF